MPVAPKPAPCKAEITTVDDVLGLIESKKVRVLATSGGKRLSGVFSTVPTFKEAGVNLEWVNFRYMAGGPNMPDYAVKYWQDLLTKMVKTPTWQENLTKFRWVDIFSVTDVAKYIDEKQTTVDKIAADLGLKQ
jgi:putative tricarboxylic transport membrane protein